MINPVIEQAILFTDTHKKFKDASIPIREAMCYKTVYPGMLPGFRDGDIFAGRCMERRITHAGSMRWYGMPDYTPENKIFGKHGGYCFDFSAVSTLPQNDEEKAILEELDSYWRSESNLAKIRNANTNLKHDVGFLSPSDLDTLVKKGLPGLIDDVKKSADSDFRSGMLLVLETATDVFRHYLKLANAQGRNDIAKNISANMERAPASLYEALQLILIFELLSHERHYELCQLDVAVGDIYAKEIDNGTITEEQAIEQIHAFYKMINENGDVTVCRLVLGGKGRRNSENADRFIQAALKAEQRHKQVTPQVTLRIYDGMKPHLLKLAYDTINETGTFPTLYNDDAIITGVAEAFSVSHEEAARYYPVGCGEFIIAPDGPALLVTSWSVPKTVDEGIRACANAQTFEELYRSVISHIKKLVEELARYHILVIDTHNKNNAFLMASLLINDCVKRGKPVLDGGARYNGGCIMGHGFTNAADSLTAIKKIVYEDKKFTLAEVLKALDANFEGYENIHKALLAVPKYGNDNEEADKMLSTLWRDINSEAKKAGKNCGLDFLTTSSVNPGGYFLSLLMGATADGRLKGTPYAICNAPTAGADKNGMTALMNSILYTDPANGGSVTNFKVSREFFTKEREKFENLFAAYWAGGGLQANLAIVNKGDLEKALKAPEKFPHLLVRMGGWTARFIDLEPFIQEEIIKRTLY